jgi:hypothetical protein
MKERTAVSGRWIVFVALIVALGTGCATSTVEKRRVERATAYDALAPDLRGLVDAGQIKVGMPMDAVYIAWGKPSQVYTGQSEQGKATTTWVYTGTAWQEQRVWRNRSHLHHGFYAYSGPDLYLDSDYVPRTFASAQVVFEDGAVKSWNTLAPPEK